MFGKKQSDGSAPKAPPKKKDKEPELKVSEASSVDEHKIKEAPPVMEKPVQKEGAPPENLEQTLDSLNEALEAPKEKPIQVDGVIKKEEKPTKSMEDDQLELHDPSEACRV